MQRLQFSSEINIFSPNDVKSSGPKVIKLFSCSTQLSMNFFMLIDVEMPTIVSISTFMSRKNCSPS